MPRLAAVGINAPDIALTSKANQFTSGNNSLHIGAVPTLLRDIMNDLIIVEPAFVQDNMWQRRLD